MIEKIYIYKPNKLNDYYRFRTAIEFFNEPIRYELEDDCLVFTRAGLDDSGPRVLRPKLDKKINRYVFGCSIEGVEDFKPGNYELDEDSNEDEKIIYLG